MDWGALADEVPLAPPDEAVEAGLEAEPEAEAEGRAELAMGTLVLPAGGATEVTKVGTTTGTELAAGAELTTAEEGMGEGRDTAGTDVATAGAEDRAGAVAVAGGAWI